jgi:YfiH family protein
MCGTDPAAGDSRDLFTLATLANGWRVGLFAPLTRLAGLAHAVTTRHGLDARLARADRSAAAAQVAAALGLEGVAFCHQVHGATVLRVEAAGLAGEGDALLTDRPGLGVMGFSADCPLVLVADPAGPGVGVAHASWRSTVQRITALLVEAMAGELGAPPERLVACICPSAGPCCYEVGGEVVQAAVEALGLGAERFFRERTPDGGEGRGRRGDAGTRGRGEGKTGRPETGDREEAGRREAEGGGGPKFLFDLWAANREQLIRGGMKRANVHTAGVCTICRNDLFPSYRVEDDSAGRFIAALGRPAVADGNIL